MSLLPVGIGSSGSYEIEKSLRFRASASAYLSRTPSTTGSSTTWTWSGWVKRGTLGAAQNLLTVGTTASDITLIAFNAADQLDTLNNIGGITVGRKISSAVYRDPSAHFHVVVVWNTTNATAADRCQLWVNGTRLTSFATSTDPTLNQNTQTNATTVHRLGSSISVNYFDGYLSEINFIDGQALDPTAFGEFDAVTGVWVPKKYTGTYGTNGFYLPFNDATSLSTLTADASGNGNNWTATNISLTAGATYDHMEDTPTNNFAVLNPLSEAAIGSTFSSANLSASFPTTGSTRLHLGTVGASTGKYYCEVVFTSNFIAAYAYVGVVSTSSFVVRTEYFGDGKSRVNIGTAAAYGASYAVNDVIGIAFDCATGNTEFFKNGVSQGVVANSSLAGVSATFCVVQGWSSFALNHTANFGQRPFAYTPPTGFLPLSTANLPAPSIANPAKQFDVSLWAGNGTTQTITNGGFQPDLVWIKSRSVANSHLLTDSVRGNTQVLRSNTTDAEASTVQGITSFNTDGFSLGNEVGMNNTPNSLVGWQWKGGGAGVANTDGTISSTVSANTAAGFSIVTYTGTGANATVGHGLGVAPKMVIVKQRNAVRGWPVYHSGLTSAAFVISLHATAAQSSASTVWNSTAPTSSVFSMGTDVGTNQSGGTYVAYCFAEVEGFSKIGSYTGNGSTDGPFVYCGFRPAFVLIKNTSSTGDWILLDRRRAGYNVDNDPLYPNLVNAEATSDLADLLSSGFKLRSAAGIVNTNTSNYIFIAFAESPFNYSRAR